MKRIMMITMFLAFSLQPLYCEVIAEQSGYMNLQKKTYFAGDSSLEGQEMTRKPASIDNQYNFESKEDKFRYIFLGE